MAVQRRFEIDNSRKHLLPRFYLRGFCPPRRPNQIYMYDKTNPANEVTLSSVRNVAVSKYAYSVVNDAILQEREHQWALILDKLKGTSISDLNTYISDRSQSAVLRSWLACFVVDSRLRSPGARAKVRAELEAMRENYREVVDQFKVELKSSMTKRSVSGRTFDAKELNQTIAAIADETGVYDQRKFEAIFMDPFLRGKEGEREYKLHEEGRWRFEEPPSGRSFITSDMPSVSLPRPGDSNGVLFTMPLSSKLQLIGFCGDDWQESGLSVLPDIDDRRMDLINRSVFNIAERFVYASSEDEIIRARQLRDV